MSVPLMPVFKKAYWSLAGLGGLYLLFLLALTNPFLQRQALYLHNVNSASWHNLSQPEQWGFLSGQVRALNITTPDSETLYAWHVLPIGAVSKHQDTLETTQHAGEYASSKAFELLQNPNTKLVINFHGNAGHVGQGWRTDTYRALTAADNENLHVLTFDYRGFGHSTGSPNESAVIQDGIATVNWALNVAKIPPERIVLVGQSLGVAVTIAVAEHFAVNESTEFQGLVLVAGFSDLPTLMETYALGHAIPIFSPMRPYPWLLNFFSSRIIERWPSSTRLHNLVKTSKNIDIQMFHARNDYDIPSKHGQTLFVTAANATSTEGLSFEQITAATTRKELVRGGSVDLWKAATDKRGSKRIELTIMRDGGHNRLMTYAPITKAVMDVFARK